MKSFQKYFIFLSFTLLISYDSFAQTPDGFYKMANKMISGKADTVGVHELNKLLPSSKNVHLIDAREIPEFEISHINNAENIPPAKVTKKSVAHINQQDTIIVYCSVGYRSDLIARKLKRFGYENVFNLYGGIFDWSNNNYKMVNFEGETTQVHPFDQKWGKWVVEK